MQIRGFAPPPSSKLDKKHLQIPIVLRQNFQNFTFYFGTNCHGNTAYVTTSRCTNSVQNTWWDVKTRLGWVKVSDNSTSPNRLRWKLCWCTPAGFWSPSRWLFFSLPSRFLTYHYLPPANPPNPVSWQCGEGEREIGGERGRVSRWCCCVFVCAASARLRTSAGPR